MGCLFTVTAERCGRQWALRSVEYPEVQLRVRRLDAADRIRPLIAEAADTPLDRVQIDLDVCLPDDVQEQIEQARVIREQARRVDSEASARSRRVVRTLHESGLSTRDIGALLGISNARAHQLIHT